MDPQELLRQSRIDAINAVGAVLCHEVSNIVGALTTCVQLLRRNPNLSEGDAELLDIIQNGSHRLDEINSAFAALGRPSPLHIERVDLHALIDEKLVNLQRDERCAPSISVHRDFDPSVRIVQLDRKQFGQAMWNLLLNAVQAMGEGGNLEIRTRKAGRTVQTSVQDSGSGIPPAVLPNIFEPLYSTKPRGVGLGLTIARRIIESHGGRIAVDARDAAGACFTILLPLNAKPSM